MVTYVGVCVDILNECGGEGTPYTDLLLLLTLSAASNIIILQKNC